MDFLAIGDVVVDAFIRLKDAHVTCRIDNSNCEICMRWGDKIPFEFSEVVPAVGNAANAAVAAARLGLRSGLRAYVGDDTWGGQCLAALDAEQVDTSLVIKQKGKKTNYHYVLWFESQRTILVKHERFEYAVPQLSAPQWVYLSSLGDNSLDYHLALMKKMAEWPNTKLAFQPGTYQIQFGKEALAPVYRRTHIFFCNREEAERILGLEPGQDPKALLAGIKALGPKVVVITDDVRGAYMADEAGACWFIPRYPDPRPPFEITGAGDAFASGTVAALALGLDLQTALLWGAADASSVLQEVGAQKGLLKRAELEEHVAHPPAPFAIRPL